MTKKLEKKPIEFGVLVNKIHKLEEEIAELKKEPTLYSRILQRVDRKLNDLFAIKDVSFTLVREGAKEPKQHTLTDTAYDLYLPEDVVIYPWTRGKIIPSGVAVEFPVSVAGKTYARSSTNKNTSIRVNIGLIDNGYRGEIGINVDNLSWWRPYFFKKGERIAQLEIHSTLPTSLVRVDELNESERGAGGFGSSGK